MGNCLGYVDGNERRSSFASNKEQAKIIQKLRDAQKQKKKSQRLHIKKGSKVVPVFDNQQSRSEHEDSSKRQGPNVANKSLDTENQLKLSKIEAIEEKNLKSALTHPTILKFLKAFMVAQSTANILDFYLDAVEIRSLNDGRYFTGDYTCMYIYM